MKTHFFTLLMIPFLVFGQKKEGHGKNLFDKVYNSFSNKKLSVAILKDGSRIEGYKKDIDKKKKQIYYIKLKEESTGKKHKLDSDEIKQLYLYPSGIAKVGEMGRHITDTRQWAREDLDNDVINKGYIVFNNQVVSLKNKKKKKEYLMQLINPTFAKYIEVYGDPNAKETFKLGVAGFNVAGGLDKSYYIKKGDKIFWLKKSEFPVRYESMFGDCEDFVKKYPVDEIKWKYLSEYILEYTEMMSKK